VTATDHQADTAYWLGIANSTDIRHFRRYLSRFPNGQFAELAHEKIGLLENEQVRQRSLWGRFSRTGRWIVASIGALASLLAVLAYFNIAPRQQQQASNDFLGQVERSRFKPDYSECERSFPDTGVCVMSGTVYWWNPDTGMFEFQPNSSPGRP
jgi:hypothetical protein